MKDIESGSFPQRSTWKDRKFATFWAETKIVKVLSRKYYLKNSEHKIKLSKFWAEKIICKVLSKKGYLESSEHKKEKIYFETCLNIWVMSFAGENSLVIFERYWKWELSTKIKLKRQRPPSRQGNWVWIYAKAKTKIYVLNNNSWKSFLENKDKMVWSFDLSPKLALWLLLQR